MSFGKKVAFGLLATLLFFGLAEVGFRVVVSLTSDRLTSMIGQYRSQFYSHINQELAYRPHPYFGYVRRDKGDNDAINRFGFWGSEWAVDKPADTTRVVALGGSTTAGPLAWPYQLEVELNGRLVDEKAQVHNLGMGGWTSAEAVAAFSMVGLSLEPDVVVVHCVNNDMEPMRAISPEVDYSHYRRAMDVVQTDAGVATYKQDLGDVVDAVAAQWSNLYVYAKLFDSGAVPTRASLHRLTTWTTDTTAEPSAEGIAIFERNLRSIAALAEANGATMVLTTMPVLAVKRPGIPTVPDGHLRSLASQNERLRQLADREGWLLVDLAQLTGELTPTFEDAIHVDVRGEKIKARAIADALAQAGLLPRSEEPQAAASE
jgi:lysophospholipase L1-like esterase